ncbi:hypothetical protein J1614_009838 [Plenodomus biglobosus]|nr:hypothetical protein J1614_009838 [Plenodomus biglobosus]
MPHDAGTVRAPHKVMGVSVQKSDLGLHRTAAKWIGLIDAKLRRVSNIVAIWVYDTSVGLSMIEIGSYVQKILSLAQ